MAEERKGEKFPIDFLPLIYSRPGSGGSNFGFKRHRHSRQVASPCQVNHHHHSKMSPDADLIWVHVGVCQEG